MEVLCTDSLTFIVTSGKRFSVNPIKKKPFDLTPLLFTFLEIKIVFRK